MVKLNLGCCDLPIEGWINIDSSTSKHIKADLTANALDLSEHFEPNSVDEIYAGHLLEHLTQEEGKQAIAHWKDLLKPGGTLAIMTPDFSVLAREYIDGVISLEEMNNLYIYSYDQESHHKYMYDQNSLMRLFDEFDFKNIQPINKMNNEYSPYGVEWQCGCRGQK